MSLAMIAYRISTDDSFAALLQQSPEEALLACGIKLTKEEETAIRKVIGIPGMLNDLLDNVYKAEGWVFHV